MKVSIITVTFNSENSIEQTLRSVLEQDYPNIEHIIVDGASSDDTMSIVDRFPHVSIKLSEADNGMYDALNKGLDLAPGDVIGILHSDDVFHNNSVISDVVSSLNDHPEWNGLYGDIRFVDAKGKTTRYYSGKHWSIRDFSRGMMPAHPSFFAYRSVFQDMRFHTRFKIAADFDLLLRLFNQPGHNFGYSNILTTDMSTGGLSTKNWRSNVIINREIMQILRDNGVRSNYFKIYSKYFQRMKELRKR